MFSPIGHIEAIYRHPVKSMAGERIQTANLGWHGLEGDRRLALRRTEDRGNFPWLTAGKLHDLVRYAPVRRERGNPDETPSHIRTPDGQELPIFGDELAAEVTRRFGSPVQMAQLKHGIFDDASISVISAETVSEIGRLAECDTDARRFRMNLVVRLSDPAPFQEDNWVGGTITFGRGAAAPAVAITLRDLRCAMLNLDPDSAVPVPRVMKAVARANQSNAGVYGTVTRTGRLETGQPIFFHPAPAN